jgi:FkbM family methyltransferase
MSKIYEIEKYDVRFKIESGKALHDDELCNRLITKNWEEKTFAFIKEVMPKDSSYIDIGAWIGTTALFAAGAITGNGICYAIEPNKKSFSAMSENFILNTYKNISAHNIAISNYDGVTYFSDEMGSPESKIGASSGIEVTCNRLQTFIELNSICNIGFIKLDTEGSEMDILPDIKNFIKEIGLPPMHISLHPRDVADKDRFFDSVFDFLQIYGSVKKDDIDLIKGNGLSELRVQKNSIKTNLYDN